MLFLSHLFNFILETWEKAKQRRVRRGLSHRKDDVQQKLRSSPHVDDDRNTDDSPLDLDKKRHN